MVDEIGNSGKKMNNFSRLESRTTLPDRPQIILKADGGCSK